MQATCLELADSNSRRMNVIIGQRVGQGIKDSDIATFVSNSGCVMQSSKIISNFQVFFWTGRNFQPAGNTILWYV